MLRNIAFQLDGQSYVTLSIYRGGLRLRNFVHVVAWTVLCNICIDGQHNVTSNKHVLLLETTLKKNKTQQ
jgi:hypothetical protein